MISVVIPLYNKADRIEKTLQSVFAQTYQDFEIVVVDDGSTDESAAIVERFSDPRIRLIHQQNAGVSAARNRGIMEAKGNYIAFLDADDEWLPEYLETQVKLSRDYPECDVLSTNYQFRNEPNNTTNTILHQIPFNGEHGILSNYFEIASCSHPPLWTSAVIVRKDALLSIGGFPIGIKSGEDLLTWAKLACHYKIAYTKSVQAIYNLHVKENSSIPKRRLDLDDKVAPILQSYYRRFPEIKGFALYISHWHKMRASVAMRHGAHVETFFEVFKSIRYNYRNIKLLGFVIISFLPKKIRATLINRR